MAVDVKSILCIIFIGSSLLFSLKVADGHPRIESVDSLQEEGGFVSSIGDNWKLEEEIKKSERNAVEETQFATDHLYCQKTGRSFDNAGRGFFFTDVVESMFSVVVNGINSMVTNIMGPGNDSKSGSMRVSYRNYQLIRVSPNTQNQVADLRALRDSETEDIKFWTEPINNKTTDVVVAPDIVSDLKMYLRERGINFKVLISDLQKAIAYQNPRMTKEQRDDLVVSQGHSMTWKRYHRYGDIMKYLEYLSLRYPKLVELITIGQSYEGQPIKMMKVSTGPNKEGDTKPAIWIDAGMHAREWIGTAVATYILSQLVERNVTYAKLLDNADWMILPVANPDGYEFSHTGDRLWRKTRSNYGENQNEGRYKPSSLLQFVSHYASWLWGNCDGVDPNRNFGYHWGEEKNGGASLDPCHETYAGPHAFSEPETKAMADYILANRYNIRMYLTLHSYSQMWLVPWGYTRSKPSDYSELIKVARKAINSIAKVHGTQYQLGLSADLMYPTSGASDDWAKGVAGIKYAYTIELRDRGTYGFLLPASQIVPTAREIWAGIRTIARLVTCNT